MPSLTTRSGAPVAPAAYGCMQWGGTADADAAKAMFDACLEAGITHFDTAYIYTEGRSEKMLGPLVQDRRDDLYLATKANYHQPHTPANLRASLEESLQRLGLAEVDLFYLHRFDPETPLEQTFEGLAALQSEGLIRHIGVSNFAAWQVMKAQTIAATFGTKIDVMQPMYNLVKRQIEVEILPMAADQDIQICAYSPLGGGLLTGKYAAGQKGRLNDSDMYAKRYGPAWMHEAAAGLTRLAEDSGVPAATLAVAWLRRHAPQAHPILSARSLDQLRPSLEGLDYVMADDLYAAITALAPTPPPATDRIEEA